MSEVPSAGRGGGGPSARHRFPGLIAAPLIVMALVLALTAVFSGPARADEEESRESAELVAQAIALIANDAGEERVAERIEDALDAPDKEGVDLVLVRRALDAVEAPGEDEAALRRARVLLWDSLGGKLPSAPEGGRLATGTETGTSRVLDGFRPARGISGTQDAVLFALAVCAVAVGLWLSVRLRPPHRIRELERRAAAAQKGKKP
ncbi:hypothetical protein [Streptomyces sp. NPDC048623]|uniref:hypothetical protein n=1 Tax=Streptomyces sp. NPDC048623 TaxID=3155761 RepID=UPI003415ADA4